MGGYTIYWHCPECDARAQLPSDSIESSVAGLRTHQRHFSHFSEASWHRVQAGEYVLVRRGEEVGKVWSEGDAWYGQINVDVDRDNLADLSFDSKRDAQAEVEALSRRILRVLV